MSQRPLYKTTITVWSDFDPDEEDMDVMDLMSAAEDDKACISDMKTERVENPEADTAFENAKEFFETNRPSRG